MKHTEQDKHPRSLTPEQRWTDGRLTTLTRSWSLVHMAGDAMRAQNRQRLELMASVSRGSNLFGRFGHIQTPVETADVNADIVQGMARGDMLGGLKASVSPIEQVTYVEALASDEQVPDALADIRARVEQQALPTHDLQDYTTDQFSQAA